MNASFHTQRFKQQFIWSVCPTSLVAGTENTYFNVSLRHALFDHLTYLSAIFSRSVKPCYLKTLICRDIASGGLYGQVPNRIFTLPELQQV